MLRIVFLIIAIFCFVFATAGMPSKVNLTALGLAFLSASFLPIP